MNKGGVLTDEVLQTYIMSAPSVVHQFFADMDIGLEWWPDSWPDLLSGGGDPDKFILPENTAEIPVKDAYHGLTDPAHVFI